MVNFRQLSDFQVAYSPFSWEERQRQQEHQAVELAAGGVHPGTGQSMRQEEQEGEDEDINCNYYNHQCQQKPDEKEHARNVQDRRKESANRR